MMKRLLFSVVVSFLCLFVVTGQEYVKIYDLSFQNAVKLKSGSVDGSIATIKTDGVVTLKGVDGYYIQDLEGDGDRNTNDAIYVIDTIFSEGVQCGDFLELVGRCRFSDNGLQLCVDSAPRLLSTGARVAPTKVIFPDDFANYAAYVGMTLEFSQTLCVTSNYNWSRYGQLTLSSHRLITPTQVEFPGSAGYTRLLGQNNIDQLVMDDGSEAINPNPRPFADSDGTRRTGCFVSNLTAVLRSNSYGYTVVPTVPPTFFGNPRPVSLTQLGNYSLKVCAFNLCYYLASDFGTGYGPANAADAAKQHQKILDACLAIDADVYGFVEVQTGQAALAQLCTALNQATSSSRYSYVNDGTSTNGSYTKVGYVYRNDRVRADKEVQNLNSVLSNRKKAQGFTQLSNGESFIYVLEHLKSKSGTGTGDNADIGDGQSNFNGSRVLEAEATVSFIERCKSYFGTENVLLMGDLNSYAMEDPLEVLYNAGYMSQFQRFDGDTAYSYSFKAQVGYLDHILANRQMAAQITGVQAFHINTDEPSLFDYDAEYVNNMYRCSDHDPVICGLSLGQFSDTLLPLYSDHIVLYPNPATDVATLLGADNYRLKIYDYHGTMVSDMFISDGIYTLSLAQLNLPKGIYLLQFTQNKAIEPKIVVLKLIIS